MSFKERPVDEAPSIREQERAHEEYSQTISGRREFRPGGIPGADDEFHPCPVCHEWETMGGKICARCKEKQP